MKIEDLIKRISLECFTVDSVKVDIQLSSSEWELILSDWTRLYFQSKYEKPLKWFEFWKKREYIYVEVSPDYLRSVTEEWRKGNFFLLNGYKIRVTVI